MEEEALPPSPPCHPRFPFSLSLPPFLLCLWRSFPTTFLLLSLSLLLPLWKRSPSVGGSEDPGKLLVSRSDPPPLRHLHNCSHLLLNFLLFVSLRGSFTLQTFPLRSSPPWRAFSSTQRRRRRPFLLSWRRRGSPCHLPPQRRTTTEDNKLSERRGKRGLDDDGAVHKQAGIQPAFFPSRKDSPSLF